MNFSSLSSKVTTVLISIVSTCSLIFGQKFPSKFKPPEHFFGLDLIVLVCVVFLTVDVCQGIRLLTHKIKRFQCHSDIKQLQSINIV